MVRFGHLELLTGRVRVFLAPFGPEKDGRHRQHRHDDEAVGAAFHVHRGDQHFGKGRIERELDHLAAERRQRPRVLQRPQGPQLEHGIQHVLLRRRIHKVELKQILDAERFQK